MAKIEVYSGDHCPYCVRAKALLRSKRLSFVEIDVSEDPVQREEMVRRSGRRTVPQIFIDDRSIGGCDDLVELDARGELDALLAS